MNKKVKILLLIGFILVTIIIITNSYKKTINNKSQAVIFFEELNSLSEEDMQEIHIVDRKNPSMIKIVDKKEHIRKILDFFKECDFTSTNEMSIDHNDVLYNINYVRKGYYASPTINICKDRITAPVSSFKMPDITIDEFINIFEIVR